MPAIDMLRSRKRVASAGEISDGGPQRRRRGYSVVEMMVTLAIIALLGLLAYTVLEAVWNRETAGGGISDVVEELMLTRSTALAQGVQCVFLLQPIPKSSPTQYEYLSFIDRNQVFQASSPTFGLPAAPQGSTLVEQKIDQNTLPIGVGLASSSLPMFKNGVLPNPLQEIPMTSPCTFCDLTTEPNDITVVFLSDGAAQLGSSPSSYAFGGSFTLVSYGTNTNAATTTTAVQLQTIAISTRTGAIYAQNWQ